MWHVFIGMVMVMLMLIPELISKFNIIFQEFKVKFRKAMSIKSHFHSFSSKCSWVNWPESNLLPNTNKIFFDQLSSVWVSVRVFEHTLLPNHRPFIVMSLNSTRIKWILYNKIIIILIEHWTESFSMNKVHCPSFFFFWSMFCFLKTYLL